MSVVWRKEYTVKTPDHRNFKVFVSETDDGAIYGSCLWYEGDRALRAPGEKSEGLRFDLKTFHASSEAVVYEKVMSWVVEKFGSDVEVTPAN